MKCELCGSDAVKIIYKGVVRTGKRDGYTDKEYPVYQCSDCQTIWNYSSRDYSDKYYESTEYRERIENSSNIDEYYKLHDSDTLFKLKLTGTSIFRNKVVADIGCGGGSFLDFVSGVSSDVVAIEPSVEYQKTLRTKYHTYPYASDAINDWKGKVDVVTNFDVIEHVPDPRAFIKDCYDLLSIGGQLIIGTPTDYPILRQMLGDTFNKFVFSIHHPWVLSENIMKKMAESAGFKKVEISKVQLYGLGNLLSWLLEKKPMGDTRYDFISETLNNAYMNEISQEYGEYIVLKAEK